MTLTQREHRVLTQLAKGQSYKQVGYTLNMGERTVKKVVQSAKRVNHCETTPQLMALAGQSGVFLVVPHA